MATTYTVRPGDTLWALAQKYGTTVQAIAQASGIKNPNRLSVGQKIALPTIAPPVVPPAVSRPGIIPQLLAAGAANAGAGANESANIIPQPRISASGAASAGTGARGIASLVPSVGAGVTPGASLLGALASRYSSVQPSSSEPVSNYGSELASMLAPSQTGFVQSELSSLPAAQSSALQDALNTYAAQKVGGGTLTASGTATAGTDPPGQADLAGGAVDPRVIDTMIAEAGGGGLAGMRAVAAVINNRAAQRGLDPASVVAQPYQFEGYSNPGPGALRSESDPAVRAQAEQAWNDIVSGAVPDPTNGGTMYHASYATPYWAASENRHGTVNIGGNLFYLGNGPQQTNSAVDAIARTFDPLPAPAPLTPESMPPVAYQPPPLPRPRPDPSMLPSAYGSAFTGGGWGNLGLINQAGVGSYSMPPNAVPRSVQVSMPSVEAQQQQNLNTPQFAGQPWINGLVQRAPAQQPVATSEQPNVIQFDPMRQSGPGAPSQPSSPWQGQSGSFADSIGNGPGSFSDFASTFGTAPSIIPYPRPAALSTSAPSMDSIGSGPGSFGDLSSMFGSGAAAPRTGLVPLSSFGTVNPASQIIPRASAGVGSWFGSTPIGHVTQALTGQPIQGGLLGMLFGGAQPGILSHLFGGTSAAPAAASAPAPQSVLPTYENIMGYAPGSSHTAQGGGAINGYVF